MGRPRAETQSPSEWRQDEATLPMPSSSSQPHELAVEHLRGSSEIVADDIQRLPLLQPLVLVGILTRYGSGSLALWLWPFVGSSLALHYYA